MDPSIKTWSFRFISKIKKMKNKCDAPVIANFFCLTLPLAGLAFLVDQRRDARVIAKLRVVDLPGCPEEKNVFKICYTSIL